jgi:acyl-CoA thioesterase-2
MTSGLRTSVGDVLEALALRPAGDDVFVGDSIAMGLPRIFGGQLLAQSLVAAARTVSSGAAAHSLHLYFLRPGDPLRPVELAVERVRDGRRHAVRSVRAVQDGRVLTTMTASFTPGLPPGTGAPDHQAPAPVARAPQHLPTLAEYTEQWGGLSDLWGGLEAVEVRVDPDAPNLVWLRLNDAAPGGVLLHQALLAYLSDVTTMAAAMVPHGVPIGIEQLDGLVWDGVSLDHAIWFQRAARADDWLLFVQQSPSTCGGRGLARADVYRADGVLAASLAQEGLFLVTEAR